MNDIFEKALSFVLSQEGGYSNNPDDRGGATNLGVTQSVYDGYRASKKLSTQSVRLITRDEAKDIYYRNYWLKSGCNSMTSVFAVICFDTAVNMGVSRVNEFLKACLWKSPELFLLTRLRKYHSFAKSASQRKFFYGWVARVFRLYDYICAM